MGYTLKQKFEHYKDVARGNVKPKKESKFTESEQVAYARGRVDSENERRRAYAYKNATPIERLAYSEKQNQYRKEHPKNKEKSKKNKE